MRLYQLLNFLRFRTASVRYDINKAKITTVLNINRGNDKLIEQNDQITALELDEDSAELTGTTNLQTNQGNVLSKKCSKRRTPILEDKDIASKKRSKTEKKPAPSVRFDQIGHFPRIDETRMVRCKNEGCQNKKSYILCPKCDVHLCLNITEDRNCFTAFHIIKEENDE